LIEAIAMSDLDEARRLLEVAPELASDQLRQGATRRATTANYLPSLGRYVYEGDSPLHVAAAAWNSDLVRQLIGHGAPPTARNRLGATPLHYAATGNPEAARWDPIGQSQSITALVAGGADPNAIDNNGSTPLHKAIRTRCAAAVETLLNLGADPTIRTRNGSTCERLATVSSGRGGSGSPIAKEQQVRILDLLSRR